MAMKTCLVVNSKGGSGKTTVSTNIASYYAANGLKTALMDYDPQGSSLHWLEKRPASVESIFASNAAKQKKNMIRSWQMNVPSNIEILVIDAPAGVDGLLLQEIVKRADHIVIPVGPSSIDIHATADFIKDLFLIGKVRQQNTRIGVIANRARKRMPLYKPLESFLYSLKIPFITKLTDSDAYIEAVEKGLGVYDLDAEISDCERTELKPLFEWLKFDADVVMAKNRNVVSMQEMRRRTTALSY
jgi:chromosome partitioning protein